MAKTAPKPEYAEPAVERVSVRITKLGDGKVSNGVHHAVLGDEYYEAGEIVDGVPEPIAAELEGRGLAEIQKASARAPSVASGDTSPARGGGDRVSK